MFSLKVTTNTTPFVVASSSGASLLTLYKTGDLNALGNVSATGTLVQNGCPKYSAGGATDFNNIGSFCATTNSVGSDRTWGSAFDLCASLNGHLPNEQEILLIAQSGKSWSTTYKLPLLATTYWLSDKYSGAFGGTGHWYAQFDGSATGTDKIAASSDNSENRGVICIVPFGTNGVYNPQY